MDSVEPLGDAAGAERPGGSRRSGEKKRLTVEFGKVYDDSQIIMKDLSEESPRENSPSDPSDANSSSFSEQPDGLSLPNVQNTTRYSRDKLRNLILPGSKQYRWLPSGKDRGPDYRSRFDRLKQMELKHNLTVFKLYTPKFASVLSFLCGFLLLLLGLLSWFLSGSVSIEVPYKEGQKGPIELTIGETLKAPVYLYFKITDFYVTNKMVVYDSDTKLVANCTCKSKLNECMASSSKMDELAICEECERNATYGLMSRIAHNDHHSGQRMVRALLGEY